MQTRSSKQNSVVKPHTSYSSEIGRQDSQNFMTDPSDSSTNLTLFTEMTDVNPPSLSVSMTPTPDPQAPLCVLPPLQNVTPPSPPKFSGNLASDDPVRSYIEVESWL